MPVATATKKKRSQADTRARLLAAALDVFAKTGYDAATTRGIAKKAGVNESLIHRYFESKLGLFFALKQQFRENFIREFLAYEQSENLEEELVRFLRSRLQRTSREKKFFKLAISRSILDSRAREDVRNFAVMKPPALFERFEGFRRRAQIRPDADLDQVIGVLHALAFAFGVLHDAIECVSSEDAERLISTAARVISRGLRPEKSN